MQLVSIDARAENRQRTRDALVDAAIGILSDEGIHRLTAARVASAANVSRRTFFNYFAQVEDLLVAIAERATAEIVEELLSRPADEPLLDALKGTLEVLLESETFDRVELLGRAAMAEPQMKRVLLVITDSQTAAFEEGLHSRLGANADPAYVAALAAASAAVFSRTMRLSVEVIAADDDEAKERQRDWVRRAFTHLFAGFDESGAYIQAD